MLQPQLLTYTYLEKTSEKEIEKPRALIQTKANKVRMNKGSRKRLDAANG
jgi:hypothetical protein